MIDGIDKAGSVVSLTPRTLRIRHGVTLSDPPLSRTIGIGLADDGVRTFFERGSPLPMRRTFVLHTTHAITPVTTVTDRPLHTKGLTVALPTMVQPRVSVTVTV